MLPEIIKALHEAYGDVPPPPARTAFALVLWEKAAYLADDTKRAAAFRALKQRVGLTPQKILAADFATLRQCAALGGAVEIDGRAARMREAAEIVVGELGGSLDNVVKLPLAEARRALQRLPGIAQPGADKILVLTRAHKALALDSNGLRVLVRLGYGADNTNYTKMYKSAIAAAEPELVQDFDWLISAHVLLRHHGQELCKTVAPKCAQCPVQPECPFGKWR